MSEDIEAINNEFFIKGLTDGLPIIPPTIERVKKMLAFTDKKSDDSLGKCPPSEREALVESVAANAVMAGCLPEYFPVVIATIQATLDRPSLRAALGTTGGGWPMAIVNGPIAKEIGVYSSWAAIGTGPQQRANLTIGRTITLCMQNIGKSVPGISEKKPFYHIMRHGVCFAENEALIPPPWEPLHVDRGFDKNTSAVSVVGEGGFQTIGGGGRPSGIFLFDLARWAERLGEAGAGYSITRGSDGIFVFNPLQAKVYTDNGWSKKDLQKYLYENCRSDPSEWYKDYPPDIRDDMLRTVFSTAPTWIGRFSKSISRFETPDVINIVVAGNGPPRTHIHMPSGHNYDPLVTKPIVFADGTPVKSVYDFKKRK
ncbi:hypothetical protein MUP77_19565 [Candidatus Bathyarchaeota archaeon]|nr:hypothetical protein [Candidatus Bathyarchaeota archaeon]